MDCNSICNPFFIFENLPANSYSVVIKEANECGKPPGPFAVQASTNLNEIENLGSFKVYPNPANDFIQVQLEFDKIINGAISIINYFGQQIVYEKLNGDLISRNFDVRNLGPGIYMILIETDDGVDIKKILKQ